jgi:polysaccharide deacetylase family protein (PEP-CTERM system associated)
MTQGASKSNILTIDVEDWFHTSALEPYIPQEQWDSLRSTLVPNVRAILELLETYHTRATFFILGWVAERYPELVQEIDACGHEIASHGYRHRLIYRLAPDTFREYVWRAKHLLEDLVGKPVLGYRATSFSIVKSTLWALDVIKEAGFSYDSSIYPVRHDIYGIDGFPRFPFVYDNGLIEVPPSTLRLGSRNIPFAGGGYFRLYPYWLTRKGIRALNRENSPALVYLHPWELDPFCPRVKEADRLTRFRQYVHLSKTRPRFERLLQNFTFVSVKEFLENAGLLCQ